MACRTAGPGTLRPHPDPRFQGWALYLLSGKVTHKPEHTALYSALRCSQLWRPGLSAGPGAPPLASKALGCSTLAWVTSPLGALSGSTPHPDRFRAPTRTKPEPSQVPQLPPRMPGRLQIRQGVRWRTHRALGLILSTEKQMDKQINTRTKISSREKKT